MQQLLTTKLRESLSSVIPITVIVLILHFTIAPMPLYIMVLFLIGSLLLILGMSLFTLGADISMMIMGEKIGAHLTKSRKLPLIIIVTFIIGVFITIAEPDLKVLARQTPAVPDMVLIVAVAIGVGIFLVVSFLRILLQIKLSYILIFLYLIVFLLASFTDKDFLAVAFDSGGVTTGPITVPFIMALGVGLSMVRGDNTAEEDSFGLVSLCSVGPIMTVLILGMFYNSSQNSYSPVTVPDFQNFTEVILSFVTNTPHYVEEVSFALLPIILFFLLFQITTLRLQKKPLAKIIIGIIYTFLGLILFLIGVNVGFMPAGYYLGEKIAGSSYVWLLIPLGMVMGYFIVAAEPAVHVLKQQVEDITEGSISGKAMGLSLSIGVAISVGLALLRVITGISIFYLLIPGYLIALTLTFFVPSLFTSIAFDSGGVASGPMAATFLMPFAMGACEAVGGNMVTDAFGIVAMVAMTPLITIQILGIVYQIKARRVTEDAVSHPLMEDSIIDLNDDIIYEMTFVEYNVDNNIEPDVTTIVTPIEKEMEMNLNHTIGQEYNDDAETCTLSNDRLEYKQEDHNGTPSI
ncbi:MAG: hypothetical protein K0S47_1596 [Herbinix sp.]|jgi:hypothetical protein|nr:hypothetical protein [Herbinix sp.]